MSESRETVRAKPAKPGAGVLGKSPATGGKVLSPAGKGGSVTIAQVRAALATIRANEKS
jgi:hypothetical protein